jgi:simple sugar transport system permease protein
MNAKTTAPLTAATSAAPASWRRAVVNHPSWFPVAASALLLILLFAGAQVKFGSFVTPGVLSSLFVDNAYLIILACGMTLVIITGGIDLSVGAVMAFSGIIAANLLQNGVNPTLVIPLMLINGALFGLMIGVLVQYFNVQPFIASLAGMFLARGLAHVFAPRQIAVYNAAVLSLNNHKFRFGTWYFTGTVMIALVIVLITAWLLARTRFGRTVYAIGGSESSAKLMGLPVARTKLLVYVISGTCAGIAGLVFTSYASSGYSLHGVGTELDTIAAVVIGGTLLTGGSGYIFGSLLGVLVYGVIKTVINFAGADQAWTRISVGVLLLAFVVVQRAIVARASRR